MGRIFNQRFFNLSVVDLNKNLGANAYAILSFVTDGSISLLLLFLEAAQTIVDWKKFVSVTGSLGL